VVQLHGRAECETIIVGRLLLHAEVLLVVAVRRGRRAVPLRVVPEVSLSRRHEGELIDERRVAVVIIARVRVDDGGEVDLDLGNYERYLNITLTRENNITTWFRITAGKDGPVRVRDGFGGREPEWSGPGVTRAGADFVAWLRKGEVLEGRWARSAQVPDAPASATACVGRSPVTLPGTASQGRVLPDDPSGTGDRGAQGRGLR